MAPNQPKPPTDLGAEGKKLWCQVMADAADQGVELDARELIWLGQAGKLADMVSRLEDAVADMPVLTQGYKAQPVANPLLPELRMTRQLLAQTLARVRVDVLEEPAPAGQSNRYRAAALTRWSQRS